ncbi:MAG: hypothetical protein JSU93_00915 [Methanobacteriota archaeon]|nr:MAG: hypothetical protein JSU93_00915 [Euryarchaeota archaeon]
MSNEPLVIDKEWPGVVKWGGLALLIGAIILVLFVIGVFGSGQEIPVPADEMLEDPAVPTGLFIMTSVGEFLLLPGALAMYVVLKNVRRASMLIATCMYAVSVMLFLASRGMIISISQISNQYNEATSEVVRSSYLASAELALETQNIYAAMALILLCTASIMFGIVMLKGSFGGRIGYVVIVASIFTYFSPFTAMMTELPIILPFIGLILTAIWQSLVGFKLFKMGNEAPAA